MPLASFFVVLHRKFNGMAFLKQLNCICIGIVCYDIFPSFNCFLLLVALKIPA